MTWVFFLPSKSAADAFTNIINADISLGRVKFRSLLNRCRLLNRRLLNYRLLLNRRRRLSVYVSSGFAVIMGNKKMQDE